MPQGPLCAAGAHDQDDRDAAQAAGKFAAEQVLDRAGWKTADIQRIEINEAFAAISIAVAKDLGLNADVVNVEGGASGAVLTTRLLQSMKRDGLKRGIVTLHRRRQGVALALETVN
jgi:acetyl-CoA C-acetyltransferase